MNKTFVFIFLLTFLVASCSQTYTSNHINDGKKCDVDSDCSFKAGCYCGCYNKDYRHQKLEAMFCTCQSTTGEFSKCTCVNNICQ